MRLFYFWDEMEGNLYATIFNLAECCSIYREKCSSLLQFRQDFDR